MESLLNQYSYELDQKKKISLKIAKLNKLSCISNREEYLSKLEHLESYQNLGFSKFTNPSLKGSTYSRGSYPLKKAFVVPNSLANRSSAPNPQEDLPLVDEKQRSAGQLHRLKRSYDVDNHHPLSLREHKRVDPPFEADLSNLPRNKGIVKIKIFEKSKPSKKDNSSRNRAFNSASTFERLSIPPPIDQIKINRRHSPRKISEENMISVSTELSKIIHKGRNSNQSSTPNIRKDSNDYNFNDCIESLIAQRDSLISDVKEIDKKKKNHLIASQNLLKRSIEPIIDISPNESREPSPQLKRYSIVDLDSQFEKIKANVLKNVNSEFKKSKYYPNDKDYLFRIQEEHGQEAKDH